METFLSESTTVKELLNFYPYLLPTFIELGMMCVGCPADAFHNLADVAKEYGLDKYALIARLETAIDENMNPKKNR
ncbi:conserved uncharacterized protein, DUF1858 [Desulfosarcina variabilis str. Montpellier]|uniref:DUF1858 domain-containing protein n=1 Tax=Desulfosarcina variabilis TaxID=2300 RepID=UPI003AFAD8B1